MKESIGVKSSIFSLEMERCCIGDVYVQDFDSSRTLESYDGKLMPKAD